MLRLFLKLAFAAGAVAAVFAFVPFGGRTLGDRWRAARTPSEFVDRTWAEMKSVDPRDRPTDRPPARAAPATAGRERPAEGHTEADRKAVDRILSEHLAGSK